MVVSLFMLTETASCRLAWPIYIHPHQLRPHGRSHAVYNAMQIFPNPWPGGWWRLEQMIRQQEVSTLALLATASRQRETILRNMDFKARRTIQRGGIEGPVGYILPRNQNDPLTVDKLAGILIRNGIEVNQAVQDFSIESRLFHQGDYFVSTRQPNGVLVRSLMSEAHYPDNPVTRRADGSILRPYDLANFVLAEHMGVTALPVKQVPAAGEGDLLQKVEQPPKAKGHVIGRGHAGWILSHQTNDSFRAINRLLKAGWEVYWLKEGQSIGGADYPPGTNWIPGGGDPEILRALAREFGLDFTAVEETPKGSAYRLNPLRLGLYRRYMGGNMDEGWTRLILDRWEFPYRRIDIDGIKSGILERLNVLLIPSDRLETLAENPKIRKEDQEEDVFPEVFLPPEYRKGLDEEDFDAIDHFVRGGGTLVLLDRASEVAWEKFRVPVRDVTRGLSEKEFFCPGSNLRARFDLTHPLAYGMPETALILNRNSPAFEVRPSVLNERISAPVVYVEKDLLKSGWLIGEDRIASKPAVLDVDYGRGRIILIGFRAQHRAQTHGTFKVLFNSFYYGPAEEVSLR